MLPENISYALRLQKLQNQSYFIKLQAYKKCTLQSYFDKIILSIDKRSLNLKDCVLDVIDLFNFTPKNNETKNNLFIFGIVLAIISIILSNLFTNSNIC